MRIKHKIIFWLLLPLFLIGAVTKGYSSAQINEPTSSEIVWHWTDDKHAERIIIFETTVDGKVVSNARFPVRMAARSEIKPEQKQKILEYNFILKKKKGRNFNDVSHGSVEGNIWEAGMEKNGIIFGISWVTGNQVILNTLHFAQIDKLEADEIAPGVNFKTYWLPKQK